ncbi:hypothetical protein PGB90_009724 [Kerria lacca]
MSENRDSSQFERSTKYIHLQSIRRISTWPIINSTIDLTSNLYGKIKDSNLPTKLLLESAEHSVYKAALLVKPVANTFEKPIRIADCMICSTIDFLGEHMPTVIQTPTKTSKIIINVPVKQTIDCFKAVSDYGVEKINHFYKIQEQNLPDENENEIKTELETCG